jgi:hypothetical protein
VVDTRSPESVENSLVARATLRRETVAAMAVSDLLARHTVCRRVKATIGSNNCVR